MSVARVTEIIASSKESFEDATRKGLKRASKTLKNVRGAWVEGQKVSCDSQGHITAVKARIIGDKGAYASVGAKVLERAGGHPEHQAFKTGQQAAVTDHKIHRILAEI